MKPAIRIGVVGVGGIAQIAHIPVLSKMRGAQLVALCDNDRPKARSLAEGRLVSNEPGKTSICDALLVGMDPAVSTFGWIHNVPDGWRRTLARRDSSATVVVAMSAARRDRVADREAVFNLFFRMAWSLERRHQSAVTSPSISTNNSLRQRSPWR